MFYRRIGVAAISGALLLPSAGAYADRVAADQVAGAGDVTVTLITGDEVVVPDGEFSDAWVRHGEGRESIEFDIDASADRLQVTPSDAAELIDAGRVDRRLFDVTKLVEYGYDDAQRDQLPVIAREAFDWPVADVLGGLLRGVGALITGTLETLGLSTATVSKDHTEELWTAVTAGRVEQLWLDGIRRPMLDESVRQVHADDAHRNGLDGSGVTVAVLDTGIDVTHPDLKGQIAKSKNFTDERGDQLGHGTHVASILAGTGAASQGRYAGVAPGARLLNAKVCTADSCPESAILAAMEWAAVDQEARIVNFSLGDDDEEGIDPLEEAVNRLTEKTGALFVAAAGNGAADGKPVISPASAEAALAVGAVDGAGNLAPFSATGPRLGDGGLKPDITAPGVRIVAARANGITARNPVGEHYQRINGTSMATPHVSGAAAILAQANPGWDADELKTVIMQTARPNPRLSPYEQGAGMLDIAAAANVSVLADQVSMEFASPRAHGSATRSLEYRNLTEKPVVLRLSMSGASSDGAALTRRVASLRDRVLVVPADDVATTTIVTKPTGDKNYWGQVNARANGYSLTTPFVIGPE